MAMFQQYQNGVRPVTGMAEAGANIGNMYAQGISNMAKGLTEGIKAYNDNSAKNDLANQKIQSLGQDIANKIAMYSQDPEISQSGVLEGLHQAASTLQDAPTKGLNQRLAIAHEAETRLAGFGNQLQEWSFLRGRAIERGISDALQQYAGTVTTTKAVNLDDPNFAVRANENLVDQKKRVMDFYGNIKKVNPSVQFDDNEFWSRWLSKAEQETSKAQGIDPSIISAQLEAIQGEKNIVGQNRVASEKLPEGAFQQGGMMYQPKTEGGYDYEGTPMQNTVKDYEATMQTPAEAPERRKKQAKQDTAEVLDYLGYGKGKSTDSKELLSGDLNKHLVRESKDGKFIRNKNYENLPSHSLYGSNLEYLKENAKRLGTWDEKAFQASIEKDKSLEGDVSTYTAKKPNETAFWDDVRLKTEKAKKLYYAKDSRIADYARGDFGESGVPKEAYDLAEKLGFNREDYGLGVKGIGHMLPFSTGAVIAPYGYGEATNELPSALKDFFTKVKEGKIDEATGEVITGRPKDADGKGFITPIKSKPISAMPTIWEENARKGLVSSIANPENKKQTTAKVADIGVGNMIVGSRTFTDPISVSERKSQVQDFLTQRFGAIDPTDPSGKRRIPVQGFEQFFQKAVPESEIQEYTTPSGIRLMRMNGKWEQMKMAEPKSIQDIRKESIGIYGKQTSNGEFAPTEFLPNSGVMVGGIFRGTDAANDKYSDEMTGLIDSRRSIRRLQEINDKTGEWASFKLSGEAIVEVTNLKAALRTDIIGVGTVSNFEQELIDRVIKDPTTFFSMESKDRAILLALSSRVDRRIQNISAAKGLTVQIRDTNNQNSRFEDLRQRYLREKGLL